MKLLSTYRIRAQFSSGMLSLAVGALIEAASVDGNDLNEGISPHFRQEKGRTTSLLSSLLFLAQEPHRIAWKTIIGGFDEI